MLRLMLAAMILMLAAMAPLALARTSYAGWAFATTVVAPALAPIFFFVVLLDMLMCGIFLASAAGAERQRFRFIIWVELVLWVILTVAWLPLILQLLNTD
ncbi:MAG: hypothetical protein V1245_02590 [Arenicellales bacterium]|nr:hypothetical protein [Arenicellales bacterium]MDP6312958.1 hypothetical protein [Arenicellales bacterium]MDP7119303.1 hypothetical protein [Arenicellales bacterium]MDP7193937.1 hypothetical protein [Arenicellales bacterium]MDP7490615.1 hypothetical protein [Arenicellales bacterium]